MTMDEIIAKKEELDKRLKLAASTMTYKEDIRDVLQKINTLQSLCPHFSAQHNFVMVDDRCPYCGKKME